jgi:probable phosphoglycerate mutase
MSNIPFNPDTLPDVPMVDRGYGYLVGTELFLVRHGESMTNTYANLVAYDPNLTALGWAQALNAGDWLAEHAPVDVVITSPMRRAHSTALAIAHA